MAKTRYRVAIMLGEPGAAIMATSLDTCWKSIEGVEAVAVADADATGLAEAAGRSGIDKTFADYREMLDTVKPDILAICARSVDQHRDMCVAAAGAASTRIWKSRFAATGKADEMVAACERTHTRSRSHHPRATARGSRR